MMIQLKINILKQILPRLIETTLKKELNQIQSLMVLDKFKYNNGINMILPLVNIPIKIDISEIINHKEKNNLIDDISFNVHPDRGGCLTLKLNTNEYVKSVLETKYPIRFKKDILNYVVEYSSPNIAKPFHMGHLRSTVIGNFVANIMEMSNKVVRLNYLGDWGTQFGFIYAGFQKLNLSLDEITEDSLKVINDAYIYANKDDSLIGVAKNACIDLEQGNTEVREFWKKLKQITLKHLDITYNDLELKFDEYEWESTYSAQNIQSVIKKLKEKNLVTESNSILELNVLNKNIPLFKSDGTSLYISRDIAAALNRIEKYKCDKIFYIVDGSQTEHLKAVAFTVKKMTDKDIVCHVPFGRLSGMSTRKGTSVYFVDILNQVTNLMAHKQSKSSNTRDSSIEITRKLAVTTLLVYFLKYHRVKNFSFDWHKIMENKGDTGVKLQYTHSRLFSLEEKCGFSVPEKCFPELIKETAALELITELSRFEEILRLSQSKLESSYLVYYLFNISNLVSRCLSSMPVKNQEKDLAEQRLLLFHITRLILKQGLLILGISPLEKM